MAKKELLSPYDFWWQIIQRLDEEHLRQLVMNIANTDTGGQTILKALADQMEF